MNYKSIITTTVAVGTVALGGIALAPAAMASTSQPALAHRTTGDVVPMTTNRSSFKCSSPAGQNLNISWSPGNTSVTVYFNNHCAQKRYLKVALSLSPDACVQVNAKTKDHFKIDYNVDSHVQSVTSPSKC